MRPYDYMYPKYLIFMFINIKEHIKKNKSKIVEN